MKIRKKFSVESAHVVRNCTSQRCSRSVHGHSAIIEVVLSGTKLDNAGMLYDFGLMKSTIKEFIDTTDHCMLIWDKDKDSYIDFFKGENDRYVILPFNPSAENLSMFYFYNIQQILDRTIAANGESPDLHVESVRYHETTAGWAECDKYDVITLYNDIDKVEISPACIQDWSDDLKSIIFNKEDIHNPAVDLQVKL